MRNIPETSSIAIRKLVGDDNLLETRFFHGWEPIHVAAYKGDTKTLKEYLSQGANVNDVTVIGMTPLHFAAERENLGAMQCLLDFGANVDKVNYHNLTPLSRASSFGKTNSVKLLLESGANPNGVDENDGYPIRVASYFGYFEVIKLLLEWRCNVNLVDVEGRTALVRTVESWIRSGESKKFPECARLLIKSGSDVKNLSRNGYDGRSLLHDAADAGNLKAVDMLLEIGVDVDSQDNDGNTPMHLASEEKVMNLLLKAGANSNIKNKLGKAVVFETKLRVNGKLSSKTDVVAKEASLEHA